MTYVHLVNGLSELSAAFADKAAPETADYQAAQELLLKLPYLKSTLSADAGDLLDKVVTASSTAKKSGKGGQIFLVFRFKLVAVKTISL